MKNKILLMLSLLLIPLSATFAETNIADLESLANKMMRVSTKEELITEAGQEKVRKIDQEIRDEFDKLSVKDKYRVLNIKIEIKKAKRGNVKMTEMKKLKEKMRQEVFILGEKDDIFVPDLTENEMKKYAEKTKSFQLLKKMNQDRLGSCPFGTFPGVISKLNPNGNTIHYLALVSDIVNEIGEWPCDHKLWYNVSKNYVWGTTADARDLLDDFGGELRKKTSGVFSLIVGHWTTFFNGMTDDLDEIVIW